VSAPLLLLLVLSQTDTGSSSSYPPYDPGSSSSSSYGSYSTYPTIETPPTSMPPASRPYRFRGAGELAVQPFPSGTPGGQYDLYGNVTPILAFDYGAVFAIELGAELRLRAFDNPPDQRKGDIQEILRGPDWDQYNEFGQILRYLRIGSEDGPFYLQAGALRGVTLGSGHLISRYDNQISPDYHPAGAKMAFVIGPTRTELFASDVVGGRIFAGEVKMDLARLFSKAEAVYDRYHFAFSAAHDAGRAGYLSPAITLFHVDADAALYLSPKARFFGFAGFGGRAADNGPNFGAVIGFSGEGTPPGQIQLGGKLEFRKQGGFYRQGMFGATYELSRFSGTGLGLARVANENIPDNFSGYMEFQIGYGPTDPTAYRDMRIVFSAAGEYFLWGRLDLDARITARLPDDKGSVAARFALVGMMQGAERYDGAIEVRYRIMPSLYAVGQGGTVLFPQPDGTLLRGMFAALGVGFDFER
jgi:hypothetical protein